MNDSTKHLIIASVSIVAGGLLFLAALNLNNPFASKDPHQSRANPSFLHRFVALQLVYFSVIIIVRECLAIDIRKPVQFLDSNTLQIISFFGSQFKFSVFHIVVGILALDFEGGSLPGLVLIIKGFYLLYPTIMDTIGGHGIDAASLDDLRRQTVEQFVGTEYSTPQPRIQRPEGHDE